MAEALLPSVSVKKDSISCLHCSYKTDNQSDFYEHSKIHLYEKDFRIKCFHCPQKWKNFHDHKRHLKKCKSSVPVAKLVAPVQVKNSTPENIWKCPNCNDEVKIENTATEEDLELVTEHSYKHAKDGQVVACPICENNYQVCAKYGKKI